ncbi:LPXTG cell wall anchor domain-containing protein [Levilactobacillus wangkuiensis]|uniref:LPXTG cell wall anchor domain-containing protein n=1 Tax=Levilactobacillus wangkuiensis TaxID=2799566 RepID=UPI0019459331|nr:LPXTG cell wall anchor domain-containing protein [Levilactobacillus wangkuiensis]
MMNFTRLRVMLLMVSGFTVGMGGAGAFGGSVALAKLVTVEHRINAIDEGNSKAETRLYKRETQRLEAGDEVTYLPELQRLSPEVHSGANGIQTVLYNGTMTLVNVHLAFVTEKGEQIYARESDPKLSLGGRLRLEVPKGYELINVKDVEKIVLSKEEDWKIKVKAISTDHSNGMAGGEPKPQNPKPKPKPQPEPKPGTNSEPDKPAKQPNTGGDKDVVAIPKPPAPSKPQTKPSTPQAPTPHPRPVQVPTITHPIGQTALATVSRPGKKPVPTLTTAPSTSTLPQLQVVNHPLSHQGAADWWHPVTANVTPDKSIKRPVQQEHQSQTAHRRPAGTQSTKAQQPGRIAKPTQSTKTTQLPQTDEQTLPLAWYGASALLGLTGLTGYRRIRR